METAKSIREDFLQQNAFRDDDQFTSLVKQDRLLETILLFHASALAAHAAGAALKDIFTAPVRERITRAKYLTEDEAPKALDSIAGDIETQLVADPATKPVADADRRTKTEGSAKP
jgi:V/A-type H+-transporting ATPase subunit A